MSDLARVRRNYARTILASASVSSPRLEEAYAMIPREEFMGPGPWALYSPSGYRKTIDANPAHL
jgi:protein-L-isoaspartate(D-aspartate) O-methyltransferase